MNKNVRQKARQRKRLKQLNQQMLERREEIEERIDKASWSGKSPMIKTPAIAYEMADKTLAIGAGGLGVILQLIAKLDLRSTINRAIPLLKVHLPYDEADHVLNLALNALSGGTCLDHLESRRTDAAYLNAVGAERIPDPTTAGDFCRRFSQGNILALMDALNDVRVKVWQQQPGEFFDVATIEADGTMVETYGKRKEGIAMNYKKQWGYHPLVVTLANTGEPLFVHNRGGARPSHEGAEFYLDAAIAKCRSAGFRKIVLRGDTDFALTEHFDRWDGDGVGFILGIDAMPKLVELAKELDESAWRQLRRSKSQRSRTVRRRRRPNTKRQVVVEQGYEDKRLIREDIAETEYQPGKCSRTYRLVIVRKHIEVTKHQQPLFETAPVEYFFYITNESKSAKTDRQIVLAANERCNQENVISQMVACGALNAPLYDLDSNWAYMVIVALALSLKIWSALLIQPSGTTSERQAIAATKRRILRMEFHTYLQRLMSIPAQIIRRSRSIIFRLLSYRPSMEALLLLHASLSAPLRC